MVRCTVLFVFDWLMLAVRCLLFVRCCLLVAGCGWLYVKFGVLCAVWRVNVRGLLVVGCLLACVRYLFAVCCFWYGVCCVLFVTSCCVLFSAHDLFFVVCCVLLFMCCLMCVV